METYTYEEPSEVEEASEVEQDFYGYSLNADSSHAAPTQEASKGRVAKSHNSEHKNVESAAAPTTPSAERQRVENLRKADSLRAKLLAKRQNTPAKDASREQTPSKSTMGTQDSMAEVYMNGNANHDVASSDLYGLESLLAEGKAAAEANIKQQKQSLSEQNLPLINTRPAQNPNKTGPGENELSTAPQSAAQTGQSQRPTDLTDAYYADLPIWLEFTGYHDVEFRNSKLRTYKERKALEEEAARIAERLEKLKEMEIADLRSLRPTTAHITAEQQPPPVLPGVVSSKRTASQTPPLKRAVSTANGIKRGHSPGPAVSEKMPRRESTNFRIRGANDSPELRQATARGPRTPPAPSLQRRISYPDARRRSVEDYHANGHRSRDPSLERRKAFYKQDGQQAPVAPAPGWDRDGRYDRTELTSHGYDNFGRIGYGSGERAGAGQRDYSQQYRASAGLNLRNGGVRYFMIKSWNHDNVATAMRDGLWATQEKNEQLLTAAFKTSRHVILLFSVNKSMQFQGYALMTSPPDPALPKPSFVAKLNWGTSPAFTLRWLATTPVHFRYIGHLKNELNRDEHGQPMAVLIGKDGQEISPEAGMGVVWILNEAQSVLEDKQKGGAS